MTPQEKIMALTDEQKKAFIEKLFTSQHILEQYPLDENGKRNFNAPREKCPVSKEDIEFLFDEYLKRVANGMNLQRAAAETYGCLYRQTSITFAPHAHIAELRGE